MFYQMFPGYNNAYHDNPNGQTNTGNEYNANDYGSKTSSCASQTQCQQDCRSIDYSSNGHIWTSQNQQQDNAGNASQNSGNESWRGLDRQVSGCLQKQTNDFTTTAAAGEAPQGYYDDSEVASNPSSIQALNSLVYASSLENAGMRPTGTSDTQQNLSMQNQQQTGINRLLERPRGTSGGRTDLITDNVTSVSDVAKHSTVNQNPMPNYIDPSQDFNPYRREDEKRKREAAEAEPQRKAAEEEKQRQAQDAEAAKRREQQATAEKACTTSKSATARNSETTSTKSNPGTDLIGDTGDDMAQFILQFKSIREKNPALFQKLLAEMSQASPDNAEPTTSQKQVVPQASVSQASGPPALIPQSPTTQAPVQVTQNGRSTTFKSPKSTVPQKDAKSTFSAHTNGYKVVVENNPEGLPDSARFPAERRIRSIYEKPVKEGAVQNVAENEAKPVVESASVSQPLPPKAASGKTIWPYDKRTALAVAAVNALNLIPENQDIQIGASEIQVMLTQNPSYIDLCVMLEKKGLRFHRGYFARALLKNVPDLTGSKGKPSPASRQARPSSEASQIHDPSAHKTRGVPQPVQQTIPQPPLNGVTQAAPISPVFTASPNISAVLVPPGTDASPTGAMGIDANGLFVTTKPERPAMTTAPPAPRYGKAKCDSGTLGRPEPEPSSKKAQARKRDFSEIMDPSVLSDNDGYVLSRKHTRIESPPVEEDPFTQPPLPRTEQQQQNSQPLSCTQAGSPPHSIASLKLNPDDPNLECVTSPFHPPLSPPPPKQKPLLAKHVDKAEALRKTYYDPRTIARDILIAAGRHPTERPLNAHMAGLLGSNIDLESDLSTFDWDATDPGGPPAPKVEMVDIPARPPRFKLGEFVGTRVPRLADEQARSAKPNSAINALGANLNRFSEQAKRLLEVSNIPNTEGRKPTDINPPESTAHPLSLQSPTRQTTPQSNSRSRGRPGIHRSPSPTTHSQSSIRQQSHSVRHTSTLAQNTPLSQNPTQTMSNVNISSTGKRIGRPSGTKNKHPSKAALKQSVKPGPRIEIPNSQETTSGHPYRCRWKGCNTDLHNLDTLAKHVAKVHHPEPNNTSGFTCWWRNCRYLRNDGSGSITTSKVFDSTAEWRDHIRTEHIHSVGIKYGDGPATAHIGKQELLRSKIAQYVYNPSAQTNARTISHTDPMKMDMDRETYLSDHRGRTTTPKITKSSMADLPSDTIDIESSFDNDLSVFYAKVHHKEARPNTSAFEKALAEQSLRAMVARKEKIGPGMEKGGCTLVNEARRASFVQNPGIARIVEDDC